MITTVREASDIDENKIIDQIRSIGIDMINEAGSGHPAFGDDPDRFFPADADHRHRGQTVLPRTGDFRPKAHRPQQGTLHDVQIPIHADEHTTGYRLEQQGG